MMALDLEPRTPDTPILSRRSRLEGSIDRLLGAVKGLAQWRQDIRSTLHGHYYGISGSARKPRDQSQAALIASLYSVVER